jgi:serine/threonine-protein kinase
LLGLSAAHEAGVLHRDFKSDNVMLREEGRLLHPVILDFGLARALDERSQHSSANERGLIGTFAYIAPEQLEGRPHSIASDIYAFGVVWFELLTGELPFGVTSSPAATTLERLTRRAPAPSSKNPLVSTELDAIVLGCLERSPSDRFKSAGEVLARLDLLEARLRAPPRGRARRALVVGVAAAAVAALAGGAQAWRWDAHDAGAHDAPAALPPAGSASVTRVPAAAAPEPPDSGAVVLPPEPRAPGVASSNRVAAPPMKERSQGARPIGASAVVAPPQPETHEDPTAVEDSAARTHEEWENPFQPGK